MFVGAGAAATMKNGAGVLKIKRKSVRDRMVGD